MTGDDYWFEEAQRAFEWYLGRNDIQTPLYNHTNGGCFDGLTPDRANQNQGAESTLSFLLSLVEMNMAEHVIAPTEGNGEDKEEEVVPGTETAPQTVPKATPKGTSKRPPKGGQTRP